MSDSADIYPVISQARPADPDAVVTVTSPEQDAREEALVEEVVASFDAAPSPRLRHLMQALTRHLHAFVRETRLTMPEWDAAIRFLTRCGHITDDRRQEFVLLSDVLGVTMQAIAVNREAHYRKATEPTVLGPFFVEGSPEIPIGGDIAGGAPGEPCWVEGTVTDVDGTPVPGARIEVWEADENGLYDVQYGDGRTAARAHLYSDDQGRYAFWGLTPKHYTIRQGDGPVGDLLAATGRSPVRPAHLYFRVTADGLRFLVTQLYARGDEYLRRDAVFGVKQPLIKDFETQDPGTPTPGGRRIDGSWSRVRFDIVLAPAEGPAALPTEW